MSGAGRGGSIVRKLRVLFVGGFAKSQADGSVGGVITASRGLFHSAISEYVEWIPVDSTSTSVPPPPLVVRLVHAVPRTLRFIWLLVTRRIDLAFILASDGSSFVEKGVMALLAHGARIPVILAPRSGFIPDDVRRSRFFRWYVPFVLRRCDRILCQGETWAAFYASLAGGSDRIVTIPNWIEVHPLSPRPNAPSQRGSVRVIYLGWVERFKGIFDLIDAAALGGASLAGASFVVCGRGGDLEAARSHAAAVGLADRFEFRGWVTGSAKEEALRDADIYVHPSHREGMPNALLEAMAAGLPCIAARSGAVPDLLRSDELGVLVEPGDVAALARALAGLASSPAKRAAMGAAARAHVLEHHSVESAWPRVLALFRSVVAPKNARGSH